MRNILYIFIAILITLPLLHEAQAQAEQGRAGERLQISVEAKLDSLQMVIGEQTGLHLSATVKQGQKVFFPRFKAQQKIAPGVEIADVPKVDTVDADDGMIKVTQHLQLTSFVDKDTLFYIPKQTVKVDGKPYQTNNLALKIYTIQVDTLHQNKFNGPKDVQDNPFLWSEWAELLWLSLAAVVMYILCILAYLRLKSNKPIKLKVKIVKKIPPHQKALNKINQLRAESLKVGGESLKVRGESLEVKGDSAEKAYYTQLTDALRMYMQERFGFNAMEMTSAEIIERLKQEEDQQKIHELTELFETADLVKFAKYTVGMSENDRNLVSAVDFINTTKQENVPTEERIEPTITEQEKQTMRMRLSLKWAIAIMVILATALIAYSCWQLYDLRG